MSEQSHYSDPRFVQYYADESATERAVLRAMGIMNVLMRTRLQIGAPTLTLQVADIGCNAGTQSRCWLERGHSVKGLDISRDLVALAQQRNRQFGARATFEVGSATGLPWPTESFDVCLLPELLEHVDDWESCLREAVRVLKPGGSLYLSTTNVLCPKQQEFGLPMYSWYPGWAKQHFLKRALTTSPELVNFASYPAVHWFSPYGLKRFLAASGVRALDRFDLIESTRRSLLVRLTIRTIRAFPPLRFVGHLLTPSTVIVGHRA